MGKRFWLGVGILAFFLLLGIGEKFLNAYPAIVPWARS